MADDPTLTSARELDTFRRAPAPPDAARTETGLPRVVPAGVRVLVVDDNLDSAELLGELLAAVGHEVRLAHDAPAALAVAAGFAPVVAILDIGLPGMDGYQLARALRGDGLPPVRLIAMTGYGSARDRERSREAGFDEHLVKPVDPRVLCQRLAALAAG